MLGDILYFRKVCGGCSIKDITIGNKAAIVKQLWAIFLECEYTIDLWKKCLQALHTPSQIKSFDKVVQLASHCCKKNAIKVLLLSLFFIECLYHIWLQGNQKILGDQKLYPG